MLYTINSISLARLNNQEFVGLMINLQKVLTDANRENLGLPAAILSQFNTLLQKMMDQVYTSSGSQFTQQMKAADEKRGTIYRRVRLKLQCVDYAEEGSRLLKYAEMVRNEILSKYGAGVPQMPMQEETAVVSGLIYDLRDKLDDDAIEELALEDDIAKLELANTAFVKAYNARTNEKAEQEQQKTTLLRQELSEMFQRVGLTVQYNANLQEEANAEKATECQGVIKMINVLVTEVRQRLNQRLKGNGESEEEGEGGNGGGNGGNGGNGGSNTGGNNTGNGGGGGTGSGSNTGGSGSGGNTGGTGGSGGGNTGNDDFVINDGTAEY